MVQDRGQLRFRERTLSGMTMARACDHAVVAFQQLMIVEAQIRDAVARSRCPARASPPASRSARSPNCA